MPDAGPPATPAPTDLKRRIGFWGALGVMIGVIVGSGIFRTPLGVAAGLPSAWWVLGVWAAGGLVCLAGALTFSELAAMHPASGGVYVFLREAYGRAVAFVFGWSYLLLVKPFAAGGIAFVFAEHLGILLGVPAWAAAHAAEHGTDAAGLLGLWNKGVTTLMLLLLTAINLRGVGLSTAFSGVLTAVKFGALVGIAGLAWWARGFAGVAVPAPLAPGGPGLTAALVGAMSGVLWTYDGWADVGSIAGEVKRPQRTLPRVYVAGTASIIGLYVLVNAAYLAVVPLAEMRELAGVDGASLAPLVVERLAGPAGAAAVVVAIMLSTLGSSHASVMTGARVSFAQARDGLLFRPLGHVHPRWHTPDVSLVAQVALAIAAVWTLGSFQRLMDGFVFTMWIFYGLAGAAVFVLRRTQAGRERPFRCPGYPAVPAVFVLAALAMAGLMIWQDPGRTLPWLGVLALGVPVHRWWSRAQARSRDACPACGYDRRGLRPGARCPECGEPATR